MTKELMDFLRRKEGLSLIPYRDQAGLPTIGYGHLLPSMSVAPITEEQAEALLAADAEKAERHALVLAPELNSEPRRLAALTDLVFNVGSGALVGSGVVKMLRAHNWPEAAKRFRKWNHVRNPKTGELEESEGLTRRREVGARWIEEG